ncbi:hypothetical protein [Ruegeria conchae]|uniref:Uncharacterized protein n=1 Tax=Ruegeria conchae TaxID=981384 RepID=A0A497ZQY4_9RHOB|nr:hypothetical protein [Ruegeria conchae]RLK07416.1 hypothetical protein CLV75_2539 [Ruegeria conchae]
MGEVRRAIVPWQECKFVSVRNAGRILGLHPDALEDRIFHDELDVRTVPGGSQAVITVESVLRLIERSEAVQLTARKEAKRQRKTRSFRLVVNNN